MVWIIVMFLSDSHSDGTHSLQSIRRWASVAMLHFSKSDEKQTHLHRMAWGCRCWFLGEIFLITNCAIFIFFINATFCNILLFNTWHSYIKCALNAQILLGATVYHHYISQSSLWSLNINISHFCFYLNSMFMVIFSASAPAGSVNSPAAAGGVRWGGQRGGARGREGASQERDTETPAPPTEGAS